MQEQGSSIALLKASHTLLSHDVRYGAHGLNGADLAVRKSYAHELGRRSHSIPYRLRPHRPLGIDLDESTAAMFHTRQHALVFYRRAGHATVNGGEDDVVGLRRPGRKRDAPRTRAQDLCDAPASLRETGARLTSVRIGGRRIVEARAQIRHHLLQDIVVQRRGRSVVQIHVAHLMLQVRPSATKKEASHVTMAGPRLYWRRSPDSNRG